MVRPPNCGVRRAALALAAQGQAGQSDAAGPGPRVRRASSPPLEISLHFCSTERLCLLFFIESNGCSLINTLWARHRSRPLVLTASQWRQRRQRRRLVWRCWHFGPKPYRGGLPTLRATRRACRRAPWLQLRTPPHSLAPSPPLQASPQRQRQHRSASSTSHSGLRSAR